MGLGRRCVLVVSAVLVSLPFVATGRAEDGAAVAVNKEDLYAALIAPSMADGKITVIEREVILTVARRILSPEQLEELQQRIAWYEREHGTTEVKPMAGRGAATDAPAGLAEGNGPFLPVVPDEGAPGTGIAWLDGPAAARLMDNAYVFSTMDGFKSPVDMGRNATMSWNNGVNVGLPLWEEVGLGVQVGASMNFGSNLMSEFKAQTGKSDRSQYFTSAGLFQRTDLGFVWGGVYDFLWDDYYLNMRLSQWRFQAGYALTDADELGAQLTVRGQGDSGQIAFPFLSGAVGWEPVSAGSIYWQHQWHNGAMTKSWIGKADAESDFMFGGQFHVPLSNNVALIGMGNFLMAADRGNTAAMTGIAIYPWGGARRARANRFAPLMPVGNNSTFMMERD